MDCSGSTEGRLGPGTGWLVRRMDRRDHRMDRFVHRRIVLARSLNLILRSK